MEFIDRGADGQHNKRGPRYAFGVGGKRQGATGEHFLQKRLTALLKKRQAAGCYCLQRRFVNIQNRCLETAIREHERQRQADVAGATDHAHIAIAVRRFRHRSMCPPATAIRIVARFKALEKAGSARIKSRRDLL